MLSCYLCVTKQKDMQVSTVTNSLVLQLNISRKKVVNVPVENFEQASKLTSAFISQNNLGSSTFYGAVILHPVKGAFAHVSYNGKVWKGTKYMSTNKISDLLTNDY